MIKMIEDFKGILVYRNENLEAYRGIFRELGIEDIVEVEEAREPLLAAKKVEKIVNQGTKKPIVIGQMHCLTAFVVDDKTDSVIFDSHCDDARYYSNPRRAEFGNGTFIQFMKGKHYVIGVPLSAYSMEGRAVLVGYDGLDKIPEQISQSFNRIKKCLRSKIFLSYDIDVFHHSVTRSYKHEGLGRMFPKQITALSKSILRGKNLAGINVAEYIPNFLEDNYKTVRVIVDLLKPLIR